VLAADYNIERESIEFASLYEALSIAICQIIVTTNTIATVID